MKEIHVKKILLTSFIFNCLVHAVAVRFHYRFITDPENDGPMIRFLILTGFHKKIKLRPKNDRCEHRWNSRERLFYASFAGRQREQRALPSIAIS